MNTKKPLMQFNAFALAPISLFIAKNDIRYYLCGISVKNHPSLPGVLVTATNGASLACWYDKDGFTDEDRIFKVSPDLIKSAKKAHNPALENKIAFVDGRLCLVGMDGGIIIDEYYIQAGNSLIPANYPDYASIIPENKSLSSGVPSCVASWLLDLFAKSANLIHKHYSSMRFYYHNTGEDAQSSKIIVMIEGCDEFIGMVMPLQNGKSKENPLPSHFNFQCGVKEE